MDNLKILEFKDFSGGWNCVDHNWLLPNNEMSVLEDWDLSTIPISVRPKFKNIDSSSARVLGVHTINWLNRHYIVTVVQAINSGIPDNYCKIRVYELNENFTQFVCIRYLIDAPDNWSPLPTYATIYRDTFYISNGLNMAGWLLKDIFGNEFPILKVDYSDGYIGKYIASFNHRFWVANTAYAPNLILCTKVRRYPNIPLAWYENRVVADSDMDELGHYIWVGDDTPLTGFIPAFGNAYAWKRDSVYLIEGTEIGYSCKQLLSGYGAIDQRNVIIVYNNFIFLDPSGKVYMWNGTEDIPRWISRDINTFFRPKFNEDRESVYLRQGSMIGKHNWSTKTTWEKDWEVGNGLIINDAGYLLQPTDVSIGYAKTKVGRAIYFNPNTEKVGEVVCSFEIPFNDDPDSSDYYIPLNYRVKIWYKWNNDINIQPTDWIFGAVGYYTEQRFGLCFSPSERVAGDNYLWLWIETLKDNNDEEIRVYGITVNYSKDEFKGDGSSENPYQSMKYCMPNAFFHNNAYYLSVADDFTQEGTPYQIGSDWYVDPCNCNKLLVFTLPPNKDKGGWTLWTNKQISCSENVFTKQGNSLLMLGRGRNGVNFETFPADSGEPEQVRPIQKLTTTSTDCGLPDNDKEFRMIALSYIDRAVGKFKVTWNITRLNITTNTWETKSGSVTFDTTGDNLPYGKIIELTSPESAGWNYGRRIQIELEAVDSGAGFYGQIDLMPIRLYYLPQVIKSEQGEE